MDYLAEKIGARDVRLLTLARADCSDDEIASYSGHSLRDMIRKYAGQARQIMHARQAAQKRKRTERAQNEHMITGVITS